MNLITLELKSLEFQPVLTYHHLVIINLMKTMKVKRRMKKEKLTSLKIQNLKEYQLETLLILHWLIGFIMFFIFYLRVEPIGIIQTRKMKKPKRKRKKNKMLLMMSNQLV